MHYGDPEGKNIVGVSSAAQCLGQDLDDFDAVLQDYHLPDMDGLELLRKITAAADVPVLFVTAETGSATAAEAIRQGAQDYIIKLGDYLFAIPSLVEKGINQHRIKKDNERLQQQLRSMLEELRIKNLQLQESMKNLRAMATTDHLTGLANRRRFAEILQHYFDEAGRYGFDLTYCMCDLDYFKGLNDMLGHQVGDEFLVKTAESIRSSLRGTDVAGRYGGDEFVLLLPHTSIQRGLAVGQRIRQQLVLESRNCGKLQRPVTISVGVASVAANRPDTPDALIAMADRALYAAKQQGRDKIIAYRHEYDAVIAQR